MLATTEGGVCGGCVWEVCGGDKQPTPFLLPFSSPGANDPAHWVTFTHCTLSDTHTRTHLYSHTAHSLTHTPARTNVYTHQCVYMTINMCSLLYSCIDEHTYIHRHTHTDIDTLVHIKYCKHLHACMFVCIYMRHYR